MEDIDPHAICSILLLDADGIHLRHWAAPQLPAFYTQALDGIAIGPGVGSCGTAASTGEPVVVEDIASHPWWAEFRELARKADVASCWSQPILPAQGQVLGSFAIITASPVCPHKSTWI